MISLEIQECLLLFCIFFKKSISQVLYFGVDSSILAIYNIMLLSNVFTLNINNERLTRELSYPSRDLTKLQVALGAYYHLELHQRDQISCEDERSLVNLFYVYSELLRLKET